MERFRRSARHSLFLLFLGLSCASLSRGSADWERADFFGMVYDGDDAPICGAKVEIDGKAAAESDSTGRFVCPGLKRGEHSFSVSKEGYETYRGAMEFRGRRDVFYLRLRTQAQLAELCLDAYGRGDRAKAEEFARQAREVDPDGVIALFLMASLAYRDKEYGKAMEYLRKIEEGGGAASAVFLLKADIFQFGLNSYADCAECLRRYLERKEDASARKRLEEVSGASPIPD